MGEHMSNIWKSYNIIPIDDATCDLNFISNEQTFARTTVSVILTYCKFFIYKPRLTHIRFQMPRKVFFMEFRLKNQMTQQKKT